MASMYSFGLNAGLKMCICEDVLITKSVQIQVNKHGKTRLHFSFNKEVLRLSCWNKMDRCTIQLNVRNFKRNFQFIQLMQNFKDYFESFDCNKLQTQAVISQFREYLICVKIYVFSLVINLIYRVSYMSGKT